jgi:hypothetical protein
VTGVVARINDPWLTNITRIAAFPRGDRIELRSMSTNYLQDPFYYVDTSATNATQRFYRVSYAPFPNRPQFNSLDFDRLRGARIRVETIPGVPCVLEASTNLAVWVAIATNLAGGETELIDSAALNYARRFYRLVAPDPTPRLSLSATNGTGLNIHVQNQTVLSCVLQASTNLLSWTNLSTNTAGGSMDFLETNFTKYAARFYRAIALEPTLPPATLTVLSNAPSGGNLVSIANPARAYVLQVSSNTTDWSSVLTNTALAGGLVSASSSAGPATALTTFVSAAQGQFMDSSALGWRSYSLDGMTQSNSWIQLTVTKTNGNAIVLGITNQTLPNSIAMMTTQLLNAVSAEPGLQGSDGMTWDDFYVDGFGAPSFHFYARSPGLAAAGVKVQWAASSDISLSPGAISTLNQYLSDLQPRNHLYLTTGLTTLIATTLLDTTALPDGYHELTAVAYEGSSIATQTTGTLPIQIRNTSLSATITLLDLGDIGSVQTTYHVRVVANTNTVTTISLFSTGGALWTATNQPSVTFSVDGVTLGAGLHRFYALVQTSDGLQYRTDTKWSRLTRP